MLLVTGITGHTGRYFLRELINHKYEGLIRCIVRKTSDTSLLDNSGLNIEKVVGDLDDSRFIDRVMYGVEVIVHIYNIHHSPMIVQAAMRHGVNRAVLVHTTGIYSRFKSASEAYKSVEAEISVLTKDPRCPTSITILRPSMIYGDLCDRNMSRFISMVDMFRIMPVIDGGNSLIQPVNARDLGLAFYSVLMSPNETTGKAYDLSGERPIKMIDVFKLISKEINKKTIFISFPLSLGVFIAQTIKSITRGKIDYVERVQRMSEDRIYSHDNAVSDFNYCPMAFENGIKIEVREYLRKNRQCP